jgi:hypothetical protein
LWCVPGMHGSLFEMSKHARDLVTLPPPHSSTRARDRFQLQHISAVCHCVLSSSMCSSGARGVLMDGYVCVPDGSAFAALSVERPACFVSCWQSACVPHTEVAVLRKACVQQFTRADPLRAFYGSFVDSVGITGADRQLAVAEQQGPQHDLGLTRPARSVPTSVTGSQLPIKSGGV